MEKSKKIVVYTCIFGDYDGLLEIDKRYLEKDVDYICFTNNKNIVSETWKIVYVEDFSLSNHLLSRKIKILGHESINHNYDILVYVDGNICLKEKITTLIKKECKTNNSLWAFKHSARNCIYEEAEACIMFKKETKKNIEKLLEFYKTEKYPRNYGLCEMGCFIRKSNDAKVLELLNLWYEMVQKYSGRDQLSFMWCVYKTNFSLGIINLPINDNKYIYFKPHKKKENIKDYRLYFGDSNYFNKDFSIQSKYSKKEDNTYLIKKVKIPCDTERIEYEIAYFPGIEFKNLNISINNKKNNKLPITFYNYYELENRKVFYNEFPICVINGKFHKGDILDISIQLEMLDKKEILNITNIINQKAKKSENNLELNKQKLKEIENKLENIQNKYNEIVNSKGWKIIEKIRKLRNKVS